MGYEQKFVGYFKFQDDAQYQAGWDKAEASLSEKEPTFLLSRLVVANEIDDNGIRMIGIFHRLSAPISTHREVLFALYLLADDALEANLEAFLEVDGDTHISQIDVKPNKG